MNEPRLFDVKDLTQALEWPPMLHPLDQASVWCPGIKLYPWQRDTLEQVSIGNNWTAISTCNESGKTSTLMVIFGLSAMVAFPGCFVYSTSGSEDQVREQLFVTQLEPIIKQLPGWNISTNAMTVTAPNGSRWKGYKCKKGGKAEGFHGKWVYHRASGKWYYRPCIYMIDEAKSVSEDIFQAVVRIDPDFMLACSTPGAEEGWFYKAIDPKSLEAKLEEVEKQHENMTAEEIEAEIKAARARLAEIDLMRGSDNDA